jgi:hypothetical protein
MDKAKECARGHKELAQLHGQKSGSRFPGNFITLIILSSAYAQQIEFHRQQLFKFWKLPMMKRL